MTPPQHKRPKRLWAAAIMNIAVGLISLFALVFLTVSVQTAGAIKLAPSTAVFAVSSAVFLILASVLVLRGKPRGRWLILFAAILFYGSVLLQNAYLLNQADGGLLPAEKLTAAAVRSGLEIAINLWALLSAKTRRYFTVTDTP